MAQASDVGASASGQTSKAQRKAAHAKRTADLKEAEKPGYKPSAEEANHPQNAQGTGDAF